MKKNKTKLEIAILQPSLTAGGVEKVLVNLLNVFDYSLFNVDLYLFKKDNFFLNQINKNVNVIFEYNKLNEKRMNLKEMAKNFKIFSLVKMLFFIFVSIFFKNEYDKKRIILKGCSKISKKKYKAVICFNGVSKTLLGRTVFDIRAKKRIVWIHGSGYESIPAKLYSYFDKIYCVSRGVKNDFDSYFPAFTNKTEVFYNVLDKKEILSKSCLPLDRNYEGFIILTVSRLSEEKGVLRIPNIVEQLKKENISFQWLLIGDGPLKKTLIEIIKNKKIENELIMLGSLKNPYNYMKRCDLYVQPSLTEGYCTTTNEAKLLCRPILVTDVNGMDEQFIKGRTAVIVDKNNTILLLNEIKRLIDDSTLRNSLSYNLRSYNHSQTYTDITSLYFYLLQK